MNKNKLIAEFYNFARGFDFDDPIISLKFQHGLSVANFCLEIADFLMLSEEEKQTAFLIGLVHEIGGFEAWNKNKTFLTNTQTLNILFENKEIEKFKLTNQQNKIIKLVLNLFYQQPLAKNNLERYTKTFSDPQNKYEEIIDYFNILKDADILDMYNIMKRGAMPLIQNQSFKKESLSRDVLQTFYNGKKLNSTQIKSNMDNVLFFISFYFDLNFSVSRVFAKKMDFASGVLFYFSDKLSQTQIERLKKIITNFLNKF